MLRLYVWNVKCVSSEDTNKEIDWLTHHKNSIINLNDLQLFAYGVITLIKESTRFILSQSDFSMTIKGQEADQWIKILVQWVTQYLRWVHRDPQSRVID